MPILSLRRFQFENTDFSGVFVVGIIRRTDIIQFFFVSSFTVGCVQCCGSGSTLIRVHLDVLDPDPFGNGDPDPGAWNWPKLTNKPGFLPFKKAFVPSHVRMFLDLLSTSSIFFL